MPDASSRQRGAPTSAWPWQGVLNTQYSWRQGRIACQLRAGITCCVFKKSLMLSPPAVAQHAPGGVQTLMAIDADRVVNLCASAHELWSLPLQIVVALCLLCTQVRCGSRPQPSCVLSLLCVIAGGFGIAEACFIACSIL